MARKGKKRHQKRLSAPRALKIPRKATKWATKPEPGPHPVDKCLSLSFLVYDRLQLARNAREVRRILGDGRVYVDGRVRKSPKFPVGLMDVVQIPKVEGNWRILVDGLGRFEPFDIPEAEADFKLAKVVRKNQVKGGKIQISLHDGKTSVGSFGEFCAGDVVKLDLPENEITDHFTLEKGKWAFVTGGSHVGRTGVISEIGEKNVPSGVVTLEVEEKLVRAPINYVFVVGRKEPVISLPGEKNEPYA